MPENLIGEGGFGKVYKVTDKDNQEYAFKKLIEVSCQDFSKLFKELAFNFMFDSDYQPKIMHLEKIDFEDQGKRVN